MILVGCGDCATFRSVPDVRALITVGACPACSSEDLGFADDFDLDELRESAKKPNPYATCPKCGKDRAYRTDFGACMQCGYKAPKDQKAAATDYGGTGGVSGMWHALVDWLRGGHGDEIPSWFPHRWLTPDEIRTHHWIHAGGVGIDPWTASRHTAGTLHYRSRGKTIDISFSDPSHLYDPTDVMTEDQRQAVLAGERVTLDVDGTEVEMWITASVNGHRHTAAGVLVPVQFNPKGDPWTFLNEQLGTVSVDHLEIQPDGTWAGTLIVPPDKEDDAQALNRAASITAASGIFSTKDGTMVYGPTTPEAIEMAMAGGRYASGDYYVGTLPDREGTEYGRPEPYPNTDPFTDVKARTPISFAHKVAEIADGIRATNPGVHPDEATRIATAAVQRYPALIHKGAG